MQKWPVGEEVRYTVQPSERVLSLPYYDLVPKGQLALLEYRADLWERCLSDLDYRQGILDCCAADPLFFINVMCSIVEPRGDGGKIPFNTWPHQDNWIAETAYYSGWWGHRQRDMVLRKSRAQGASWGIAAEFVRALRFRKHCFQGIVSKDAPTADNPNDPNSFGWKVDFLISELPVWFFESGTLERRVTESTWHYKPGSNYIMAEAAVGKSMRGGRLWRCFMDESAYFPVPQDAQFWESLRDTCHCRIAASTPNGIENKFYDLCHVPTVALRQILHWQDNPDHNQGLYTTEHGRLKVLDGEPIHGYPYVLDGRIRSPWYDAECERAANMIEIARELDIDFGGSKGRPFSDQALANARRHNADPVRVGMFTFHDADPADADSMLWTDGPAYPFKLWKDLGPSNKPEYGNCVVACDIAAGTAGDHSTNSVLHIISDIGEQLATWAANDLRPELFAQLAVAVCYWIGKGQPHPYLIWENNGPTGRPFTNEVIRLQYPNVYYMRDTERRGMKRTNKPGYHNSKRSAALTPLVAALANNQLVIRCEELVRECGEYVYGKNGDWEHPKSISSMDESSRGFNHGDRAMAMAMAVIALRDRRMLPEIERKTRREPTLRDAPCESMAGRYRDRLRRERERQEALSCVW